jgi:hypothetical protein
MNDSIDRSSTDYSSRDSGAQLSTSVMIARKDDIPLNVFYDYWGDVHGVLAARAEGAANYWQHRLGAPLPGFFPVAASIDQAPPAGSSIVGLAEITFADSAGREALIRSAAVAQMVMDEQNVLKGTYMYSTAPGNAITLLDRFDSNTPQGAPQGYNILAFIRKADAGVSVDSFRDFIRTALSPVLTEVSGAMKVRAHLLETYDSAAWPTPNVDHERAPNQQYNAYIELAFENEQAALAFSTSHSLEILNELLVANVSAITSYPSFHKNTMVYGGRPTYAGLRGTSAMRTLEAVGNPGNEQALPLLKLIFGEAVEQPLV